MITAAMLSIQPTCASNFPQPPHHVDKWIGLLSERSRQGHDQSHDPIDAAGVAFLDRSKVFVGVKLDRRGCGMDAKHGMTPSLKTSIRFVLMRSTHDCVLRDADILHCPRTQLT